MYCKPTVPPFRIQLPKAVIQKVTIPGRGDEMGEGSSIPDTVSDAELLRTYAGQVLNLKCRFDDLELPENAAQREEFIAFWNGWQDSAVRVFVKHHDTLYPTNPLMPPIAKQHMTEEAFSDSVLEAARQIFQKKSPIFFQKNTSNSYTVRMRVRVPASFDPRKTGYNDCTFFRNNGATDASGALNLEMCDASVLRRGARVVAVFGSGGMYMNASGDVGHHVQAYQMVVEPYTNTVMSPAQRLSVHLPGISSINILVPTEAPEIPGDEEGDHNNNNNKTGSRKRSRQEEESKIADFFEEPAQHSFA